MQSGINKMKMFLLFIFVGIINVDSVNMKFFLLFIFVGIANVDNVMKTCVTSGQR